MTHVLLSFFFLINLMEYVTLVMDWSFNLDDDNMWCSWYMFSSQTSGLLNILVIICMIYFVYNPINSKSLVRMSLATLVSVTVISLSVSSPSLIYSGPDDDIKCNMIILQDSMLNNSFFIAYNSGKLWKTFKCNFVISVNFFQ